MFKLNSILSLFLLLTLPNVWAANTTATINSEPGSGRGNQWTAGGVDVGTDNQSLGGSASTISSGNRALSVPFSNPGVSGLISNVELKVRLNCNLCILKQIYFYLDDNSGTFTDSTDLNPGNSYADYSRNFATNPITSSAWTWSEINDLNAGLKTGSTLTGGSMSSDYLEAVVTYDPIPTISVSNPGGGGASARQGESYVINFAATDDDSATVSLYYDTDTTNCSGTGTLITNSLTKANTSYSWDLGSGPVPNGVYYICAVINDSVNPIQTAYSAGTLTVNTNAAPTLSFTTPGAGGDTVNQGSNYTTNFTSSDSDADPLTVSLYYDTNTNDCAATGTLLDNTLNQTDTSYIWDTTGVPSSSYYLCASVSDGVYTREFYSPGKVTVNIPGNSPPTGSFPALDLSSSTIQKGSFYDVSFNSSDADADSLSIDIFYDTDQFDCSSTGTSIAAGLDENNSTTSWDTSSIPTGSYYICMTIDDSINGVVEVYSTNTITIATSLESILINEFNGDVSCGALIVSSKNRTLKNLFTTLFAFILINLIFLILKKVKFKII